MSNAAVNHAERQHALLSASGAHRWLNCPPSARLEDTLPDTTSEAAAEGTLAHEMAELRLRKQFVEGIGPRKFGNMMKVLRERPLYDPEMERHIETYYDYVADVVHSYTSSPKIWLEQQLDYSHIAPEGFGTCDCLIIGGDTLRVIDFKYGKGVSVSAVDNEQMKLYALGALRKYGMFYPIEWVMLAIVQPRNQSEPREWSMHVSELAAWGESVKPVAQQAYDGTGGYAVGEWCRFCRAKAQCRARAEQMLEIEGFTKQPPALLTNEEISALLSRARIMAKWADELDAHALAECLAGRDIPGYKAVEGRKTRAFIDQNAAFAALSAAGYNDALLYKRTPVGFTEIDKLLGKDYEKLLSPHVTMKPGKPTLVPESDKRPAFTNHSTAEKDFAQPITQ